MPPRSWHQRERSAFYETMEVEVSKLPAALRPAVTLITDAQLRKMRNTEAKNELARRELLRKKHVKEGRARYVFPNPNGGRWAGWWVSNEKDKRGSNTAETQTQAIQVAKMLLVHQDEGGVIYVTGTSWDPDTVIDVRPSECEHLLIHGVHEWSYAGTGDDVCSSCGLVT